MGTDIQTAAGAAMPIWLKLVYTAFVAVLVPVYWVENGPANFLWFSDIALLGTLAALWWEHKLLTSTMAVSVLLLEGLWTVSFGLRFVFGIDPVGLTGYMTDPVTPSSVKVLSGVFHIGMPLTQLWMIARLGYDSRALWVQTVVAWGVLAVTYAFTEWSKNINWVFGFGTPPHTPLAPLAHLAVLMAGLPILVYWPTHWLLQHFARWARLAKGTDQRFVCTGSSSDRVNS